MWTVVYYASDDVYVIYDPAGCEHGYHNHLEIVYRYLAAQLVYNTMRFVRIG